MTSAHVIEELRFDIDFASEDEAFEVQERLMRFAQGRAQQVIAEVFDQANEPDAILRLEKLEVDIGTVAAVDFEDRFAERLRDELQMLLRDRRAQLGQSADLGLSANPGLSVDPAQSPAERRALEFRSRLPEPGKSESPSVDHLTTGVRAELEWLLHFIERGCLPWHAPAHLCRDMHALAARVLETNGAQLARALRTAPVSQWRMIFRRLVAQFPAEWLAELGRQIGLAKQPPGAPVRLHQRGYITNPVTKAKSIGLTDAGMRDTAIAASGATIDASTCSTTDAAAHSDVLSEVDPAVPGGAREGLARSRARAQIESVLGEPPGSDFTLVESVPLAVDTWRHVLRDDAPWLKATLLHLGRSIRVRRRLAAVLPVEIVPELLALWLSPAQVDVALGTLGAGTAPFASEVANTDISCEAISATRLLATLTHILVDGGDSQFNESGYRHSLAKQTAPRADEAPEHDGIFASWIPAPHSSTEPLDKARGSPQTLDAPRKLPEFTRASSLENRISVAANFADQPATDAAAKALALSNSPAAADQNAHPDAHLLSHVAAIYDARPETSTTVQSDADLTAHPAPDSAARAAAHSDTDLTVAAKRDSATRTAGHCKALSEVESAVPDAAHFKANSKPTEVAALSPRPLSGSEIRPGTNTVAHDDLPETRSRSRAQIEAILSESPGSDFALISSVPVAADTWSHVLRDDGPWLKATLLRLGRSIRVRRRLAAVLPVEVVPEFLALWLSPARVDGVLASLGAGTAPFAREMTNTDISREAVRATRLLATLTYILVDGGDSDAAVISDAAPETSATVQSDADLTAHPAPDSAARAAAHSDTDLTVVTTRDSAARTTGHSEAILEVESAVPDAAHLEANSKPTESAALSPRTWARSGIPRATNTVAYDDDLPKTLARSQARAQIEAVLGESPASDFALVSSMPVAADTWRAVLRDDAPWLKVTLMRFGRGIRARRRLVAMLPNDAVPDLLALWLSPTQVDIVLATIGTGAGIAPFTREAANNDVPREAISPTGLLATLTYVLVETGVREFSESGYRHSLANQTARLADEALDHDRISASSIPAPHSSAEPRDKVRGPSLTFDVPCTLPDFAPASLLENGISAAATLADQPAIVAAANAFAIFNSTAVADQDASSDAQAATPTRLADSTAGAILAAATKSPPPYDDDLLRHLRGEPTPGSTINVLRRTLRVLLDQRSAAARHALLSALEYPRAAHRCAALLAVGDLPDLLRWLRPTDGAIALAVADRVTKLGQSAGDHTTSRRDEAPGLSSPAVDGIDTERHTEKHTDTDTDTDTDPDVLAHVVNELLLTDLFEEGRTLDPEPLARRLTVALGATLSLRAQSDSTGPERARPSHFARTNPRIAADSSQVQAASQTEDDTVTQRIYVANAGVVIVGPYLPRLFSMLGLTNKESFTTLRSAHRAVHLIQYIVTRSTVTPEPLLVLNKILCGLPVSAPIPLEIDLRAPEQAAIEDMLTAIIAHWKAIGSTSIAGLRESFLQREGRLVFCDDAWRLRVESKCFDMLLDRLPWGYATVKFPWMKRVLHVDWR